MLRAKFSVSKIKNTEGYITLLSVLIIGAVGLAIAVSLLSLGADFSRSSFAFQQSNQSKALANACAEEGLQQIRSSTDFSGGGNLNLAPGSCDYSVTNFGGENRKITATGTVGSIVRKVEIEVDMINPKINLTSWQEVADF
jgi:hypothetical protein